MGTFGLRESSRAHAGDGPRAAARERGCSGPAEESPPAPSVPCPVGLDGPGAPAGPGVLKGPGPGRAVSGQVPLATLPMPVQPLGPDLSPPFHSQTEALPPAPATT
ncbi:hypothetical protein GCM10010275_69550 [Streptomyces litmocidini]|nr:hypothetical protein GCM10010275_69550 [Streptomyces litmocidini]